MSEPIFTGVLTVKNPDPDAGVIAWRGLEGKRLMTISPEGLVTLAPDIDLAAVKALPLPYLRMVREMVATAIYDAERGK